MRERTENRSAVVWIVARVLLLGAFLLLVGRTIEVANRRVHDSPSFALNASAVAVLAAPEWLTSRDLVSIRADTDLAERSFSFFQADLLSSFGTAYLRSPWVKRVVCSRACYPNRARIALELRKPLAGVLVGDRDIVMVDEEGVRLPGVRRRPPSGLDYPFRRIVGIDGPPPAPGEVWSGRMREGVAVARELLLLPREVAAGAGIHSLDLSLVDRAGPVLLLTGSCTVVEWGRSRSHEFGLLGPSLGKKIEKLARALDLYPGLGGLRRVKLQFDGLTVEEGAVEARGD